MNYQKQLIFPNLFNQPSCQDTIRRPKILSKKPLHRIVVTILNSREKDECQLIRDMYDIDKNLVHGEDAFANTPLHRAAEKGHTDA